MSDNLTTAKVIEQIDNLTGFDRREIGVQAVGPGWHDLVNAIYDKIAMLRAQGEQIHVSQVKEKFGMLRMYVHIQGELVGSLAELDAMVRGAEQNSGAICERCGQPGRLRDLPWVQTLCDEHFATELTRVRTKP